MLGEPKDFWGKLEQDEAGRILAWNSVEAHCADVAACTEALLLETLLGTRMAALLGRESLPPVLVERLVVLAALHDLGKYSIAFQNRPYPSRQPQGGHVEPIVKALSSESEVGDAILGLLEPLEGFGETWGSYLAASISHHGRPEKLGESGSSLGFDERVFRPTADLDPLDGMARLIARTRTWCPKAYEDGAAEAHLPHYDDDNAGAEHFFAGVVMLADWLGSDRSVFGFVDDLEADPMPLARRRARRLVGDRFLSVGSLRDACDARYAVFGTEERPFSPRPAQARVGETALPGRSPSLTVLEAETGSGKTEAAIHRFAQLFRAGAVDGMYFALPTRTSATQIHRRVVDAVAATFADLPEPDRPPVVLAVPGYLRVDSLRGQALPGFRFLWPDSDRERVRHRTWAAENRKRFLAGSIVVGTIDQVLLSTLVVGHAHLRATALSRLLLVVDEVHASDAYMSALLDEVLSFHFRTGGHAFLMSATLGTTTQREFFSRLQQAPLPQLALEAAKAVPYPAVHHGEAGASVETRPAGGLGNPKRCAIELWDQIDEPGAVAERALDAAKRGAKVLVLRNTVREAIATQHALEALAKIDSPLLFRVGTLATLHHSRFADPDRRRLDEAVEAALGKHATRPRGLVVVATQTVQQSLDLDADLLITDLCPMDVLLQRIGRLHRHRRPASERPEGFREARCVVLDPGPLSDLLDEKGEVKRGHHGLGNVYEDLRILEATRTILRERQTIDIPADNRALVELTTHPEALAQVVARCGSAMARHADHASAGSYVKNQLARGHAIDRQRHFGEYGFPDREISGRISTRLGEEDRLLELSTPLMSAFGEKVVRLKIPHWMAEGWPAEIIGTPYQGSDAKEAVIDVSAPGGPLLERITYDRFGLRSPHNALMSTTEETQDD